MNKLLKGYTYVTPNWSGVQDIVSPNERVDEFQQASNGGPKNVGTSADVPSLDMPWKRNENKEETEESKDREKWVVSSGVADWVHGEAEKPRREVRVMALLL